MIILGLSGKKCSGKTTVAYIIKDNFPNVHIVGFADALKQEVARACGVSLNYMEQHKEIFRPMYQWWGTDFKRNLVNPMYWLKHLDNTMVKIVLEHGKDSIIIVSDVRFDNEYDYIVNKCKSPCWRIERPVELPKEGMYKEVDKHPSETNLDGFKFNDTITNNSTLNNLKVIVLERFNKLV